MRLVVGRQQTPLDADAVRARAASYQRTVIDIGTGAGSALLRRARLEKDTFFIGIDPAADNMREASDRAHRRPDRGGVPNLAFVSAAAHDLPGPLAESADEVTVVLPWGTLLQAVLLADAGFAGQLVGLLKPGGRVEMLLSVAQSDVRAGAIDFDEQRASELAARYGPLGLKAGAVRLADEQDVDRLGSSWGRRLAIPRRRQAWILGFDT